MLVLVGGKDFALASNLKVKENASEKLVIGISCTHVAIKDPVTNKMWGVSLKYGPCLWTLPV